MSFIEGFLLFWIVAGLWNGQTANRRITKLRKEIGLKAD